MPTRAPAAQAERLTREARIAVRIAEVVRELPLRFDELAIAVGASTLVTLVLILLAQLVRIEGRRRGF